MEEFKPFKEYVNSMLKKNLKADIWLTFDKMLENWKLHKDVDPIRSSLEALMSIKPILKRDMKALTYALCSRNFNNEKNMREMGNILFEDYFDCLIGRDFLEHFEILPLKDEEDMTNGKLPVMVSNAAYAFGTSCSNLMDGGYSTKKKSRSFHPKSTEDVITVPGNEESLLQLAHLPPPGRMTDLRQKLLMMKQQGPRLAMALIFPTQQGQQYGPLELSRPQSSSTNPKYHRSHSVAAHPSRKRSLYSSKSFHESPKHSYSRNWPLKQMSIEQPTRKKRSSGSKSDIPEPSCSTSCPLKKTNYKQHRCSHWRKKHPSDSEFDVSKPSCSKNWPSKERSSKKHSHLIRNHSSSGSESDLAKFSCSENRPLVKVINKKAICSCFIDECSSTDSESDSPKPLCSENCPLKNNISKQRSSLPKRTNKSSSIRHHEHHGKTKRPLPKKSRRLGFSKYNSCSCRTCSKHRFGRKRHEKPSCCHSVSTSKSQGSSSSSESYRSSEPSSSSCRVLSQNSKHCNRSSDSSYSESSCSGYRERKTHQGRYCTNEDAAIHSEATFEEELKSLQVMFKTQRQRSNNHSRAPSIPKQKKQNCTSMPNFISEESKSSHYSKSEWMKAQSEAFDETHKRFVGRSFLETIMSRFEEEPHADFRKRSHLSNDCS